MGRLIMVNEVVLLLLHHHEFLTILGHLVRKALDRLLVVSFGGVLRGDRLSSTRARGVEVVTHGIRG